FGWAHLAGGYLQRETVQMLFQSQRLADGSLTGYGIGWSSGTDSAGRPWVGHTGGSVGGRAVLSIYPESRVVVAALANLGSAPMTPELAERLAAPFIKARTVRLTTGEHNDDDDTRSPADHATFPQPRGCGSAG